MGRQKKVQTQANGHQKNMSLLAGLDEKNREGERERRRELRKRRVMMQVFIDLLPHLPATLGQLFKWQKAPYIHSYGSGRGLSISLIPTGNLSKPAVLKRTLGTITKVEKALTKQGWDVRGGHAKTNAYDSTAGILIDVVASQHMLLPGQGEPTTYTTLSFTFQNIPETETCKLVEKEVPVDAVYEPAHTETRMVVECEEKEEAAV